MAIRIAGMASGMDTDAMVQDLVKAYKTKGDKNTKTLKRAELKQEKWKDLNKKIKSFTNKYVANMKFSSYYSSKKTTVSDSTKASVVASDGAITGTQELEVGSLAKTAYLTGGELGKDVTSKTSLKELAGEDMAGKTITVNDQSFTIGEDWNVGDFVSALKGAGVNANFDENNHRLFISAKNSGDKGNIVLGGDEGTSALFDGLKISDSTRAGYVPGSDAQITLNGATFTSSSNTFSINGLTITAMAETNGEKLSINTDTDYDAIYDKVKSFIKDYNSLINEITELYNAPSNKGYDPLTDDEKEALSDSEIKKWESKVNESLLRKDSNLASLQNVFKTSMLQTYEFEGKTYSLSSFGINTSNYFSVDANERNAFHIDGDPDDSESSGNPDKLKAAIAANPEAVSSFFTNLASNLYDKLSAMSKSSETRSFGSYYDDKQMKTDITKYEKKVSDWDDYVKEIEDRYYKQFAKMESAMTKLNSQQSYLSGMFGG
jgi:flagellar hook-associated protein 2